MSLILESVAQQRQDIEEAVFQDKLGALLHELRDAVISEENITAPDEILSETGWGKIVSFGCFRVSKHPDYKIPWLVKRHPLFYVCYVRITEYIEMEAIDSDESDYDTVNRILKNVIISAPEITYIKIDNNESVIGIDTDNGFDAPDEDENTADYAKNSIEFVCEIIAKLYD